MNKCIMWSNKIINNSNSQSGFYIKEETLNYFNCQKNQPTIADKIIETYQSGGIIIKMFPREENCLLSTKIKEFESMTTFFVEEELNTSIDSNYNNSDDYEIIAVTGAEDFKGQTDNNENKNKVIGFNQDYLFYYSYEDTNYSIDSYCKSFIDSKLNRKTSILTKEHIVHYLNNPSNPLVRDLGLSYSTKQSNTSCSWLHPLLSNEIPIIPYDMELSRSRGIIDNLRSHQTLDKLKGGISLSVLYIDSKELKESFKLDLSLDKSYQSGYANWGIILDPLKLNLNSKYILAAVDDDMGSGNYPFMSNRQLNHKVDKHKKPLQDLISKYRKNFIIEQEDDKGQIRYYWHSEKSAPKLDLESKNAKFENVLGSKWKHNELLIDCVAIAKSIGGVLISEPLFDWSDKPNLLNLEKIYTNIDSITTEAKLNGYPVYLYTHVDGKLGVYRVEE